MLSFIKYSIDIWKYSLQVCNCFCRWCMLYSLQIIYRYDDRTNSCKLINNNFIDWHNNEKICLKGPSIAITWKFLIDNSLLLQCLFNDKGRLMHYINFWGLLFNTLIDLICNLWNILYQPCKFRFLARNRKKENRIIEMLICNTIRKGIISLLLYNPKLKYATMTCTSDTWLHVYRFHCT